MEIFNYKHRINVCGTSITSPPPKKKIKLSKFPLEYKIQITYSLK